MKTITIESEFESSFDVYGIELITGRGIVQVSVVNVSRERANCLAEYYLNRGWLDVKNNVRYKVYQANIVNLTVFV